MPGRSTSGQSSRSIARISSYSFFFVLRFLYFSLRLSHKLFLYRNASSNEETGASVHLQDVLEEPAMLDAQMLETLGTEFNR